MLGFGQNPVKTIPQGYLTYDVISELNKASLIKISYIGCHWTCFY